MADMAFAVGSQVVFGFRYRTGAPDVANGAFVVEQGDPWGDFACFVVGATFTCPRRGAGETPVGTSDATIRYTVSIAGTVESSTAMAGTQRVDVECVGADCALAPAVAFVGAALWGLHMAATQGCWRSWYPTRRPVTCSGPPSGSST